MTSSKFNSPIPKDLLSECRKCANILSQFLKPGIPGRGLPPDQFIPNTILTNAKGIAVLTVIKAGFIWAGRAGSGLVVARLPDGTWSAPSAIGTAGMSFGGQIGAELTDFVVVLNTDAAVKAFTKGGNVSLGGNLSVSIGPIGRTAEAAGVIRSHAPIYSYSKSKGLFAGVSLEGSVLLERKEANKKFYKQDVTAKQLLRGEIPPPREARELYLALDGTANTKGSTESYISTQSRPESTQSYSQHTQSRPQSYSQSTPTPLQSYTQSTPAPPESYTQGTPMPSQSFSQSAQSRPQSFVAPAGPPPNYTAISPSSTIRSSLNRSSSAKRPPPPIPPKMITAIALYDFNGEQPGDLSFKAGDVITVVKKGDSAESWWEGRVGERNGIFPANYVQLK